MEFLPVWNWSIFFFVFRSLSALLHMLHVICLLYLFVLNRCTFVWIEWFYGWGRILCINLKLNKTHTQTPEIWRRLRGDTTMTIWCLDKIHFFSPSHHLSRAPSEMFFLYYKEMSHISNKTLQQPYY